MNIVIMGGGKVGESLARRILEGRRHEVRIIESDRARSLQLANALDVEIICGDRQRLLLGCLVHRSGLGKGRDERRTGAEDAAGEGEGGDESGGTHDGFSLEDPRSDLDRGAIMRGAG